jgi:hypothetical protein
VSREKSCIEYTCFTKGHSMHEALDQHSGLLLGLMNNVYMSAGPFGCLKLSCSTACSILLWGSRVCHGVQHMQGDQSLHCYLPRHSSPRSFSQVQGVITIMNLYALLLKPAHANSCAVLNTTHHGNRRLEVCYPTHARRCCTKPNA